MPVTVSQSDFKSNFESKFFCVFFIFGQKIEKVQDCDPQDQSCFFEYNVFQKSREDRNFLHPSKYYPVYVRVLSFRSMDKLCCESLKTIQTLTVVHTFLK